MYKHTWILELDTFVSTFSNKDNLGLMIKSVEIMVNFADIYRTYKVCGDSLYLNKN